MHLFHHYVKRFLNLIVANKRLIIGLGILSILLIVRVILLQKNSTDILYTVKRGSLVDTVQVTGTYSASSETDVYSPTNGVITDIFIANNQYVKKGDKLFHVESTATTEEKASAYANYQSALSSLNAAQNTKQSADSTMWIKQKALLDAQSNVDYKNDHIQNPTTKRDYTELEKRSIDAALTQAQKDFTAAEQIYKTSDSSIAAAYALVNQTQIAYAQTQDVTVVAQANGTIVNFLSKIGDAVTASSKNSDSSKASSSDNSSDEASPVLLIVGLEHLYMSASINEAYMPRLAVGQKASIVFDSLKSKTFKGYVEALDTVGTNKSGLISYNARIFSNDISSAIKPNMTALLTIETFRKDHVLAIPNASIIKKGDKAYVRKIDKRNNSHSVEVLLGEKGLTKTIVSSGLSEGDVIVANPSSL